MSLLLIWTRHSLLYQPQTNLPRSCDPFPTPHVEKTASNTDICISSPLLYRHCFEAHNVPIQWKTTTTILIHKKNSTTDASNFRPITLMSCLYKLLMAIIGKFITNFAIQHDLLSPEQKSACPSKGCYEHAFLLK